MANAKRNGPARIRRIARVANIVGVAILLWVFFFPRPFAVALTAAALAPIAGILLVLLSKGSVAFDSGKGDRRPEVTFLLLAGMGVLVRALEDVELLDWSGLLVPSLTAAPIAVALTWVLRGYITPDRVSRTVFAFGTILVGMGYVLEANTQLDNSRPQRFAPVVLSKHVSSGRSTSHQLELAPWGPRATAEDVTVGQKLYERVHAGQQVCVYLWTGALKIRWFEVDTCPMG